MSSRREVLIRILALLQRKTLLKTKNRTLKCKCLKRHYSTVQSMRNVGVDGGRGFFPLFSSPPRGIWQLNSPHPRPLPFKAKKLLMPGGQPGEGWAQLELTDALYTQLLQLRFLCRFLWSLDLIPMLKRKSSVANFLCRSLNWNHCEKKAWKKFRLVRD